MLSTRKSVEMDERERAARLAMANAVPHEGCRAGRDCAGDLMSMPGGRTLCDRHRVAHYMGGGEWR